MLKFSDVTIYSSRTSAFVNINDPPQAKENPSTSSNE